MQLTYSRIRYKRHLPLIFGICSTSVDASYSSSSGQILFKRLMHKSGQLDVTADAPGKKMHQVLVNKCFFKMQMLLNSPMHILTPKHPRIKQRCIMNVVTSHDYAFLFYISYFTIHFLCIFIILCHIFLYSSSYCTTLLTTL